MSFFLRLIGAAEGSDFLLSLPSGRLRFSLLGTIGVTLTKHAYATGNSSSIVRDGL